MWGRSGPSSFVHVADVEIMMDLLGQPKLRSETERVFERGVVNGAISEVQVGY